MGNEEIFHEGPSLLVKIWPTINLGLLALIVIIFIVIFIKLYKNNKRIKGIEENIEKINSRIKSSK